MINTIAKLEKRVEKLEIEFSALVVVLKKYFEGEKK